MARIFITGSSDGLGLMAARILIGEKHRVVLHARNEARARHALEQAPGAETALYADLSNLAETTALADQVNALGQFDAVIHNAAVGYQEPRRIATADGLPHVFAVNSLAPYVLTARITRPKRLIYISSKLHQDGDPSLQDLTWEHRQWDGRQAYSDSKLHTVLLGFGVARRWPEVLSNCVEPGWVATKMGGVGANDDLDLAPITQAWLAAGTAAATRVSGDYFYHQRPVEALQASRDVACQEAFLAACARLSGIEIPLR